jgi:hypothetical protein
MGLRGLGGLGVQKAEGFRSSNGEHLAAEPSGKEERIIPSSTALPGEAEPSTSIHSLNLPCHNEEDGTDKRRLHRQGHRLKGV